MLYLTALALLTIFIYISFQKELYKSLSSEKNNYGRLKYEYGRLSKENTRLKTDNSALEQSAEKIIALYDITKEVCKALEEDKIFSIFKDSINRYIKAVDCRFLKPDEDLAAYKDYTVLPLMIHKQTLGYLVAGGIKEEDLDKFHILTQQFLLGIKRALLYKKVQELTITDTLTQVFNRRHLLDRLNEEMERSKKFNYNLSFLMADIDHFKKYNDHYGHLVGDAILRETSRTIKENLRQIDFMGRYGGEEFLIILTMTDKEQAKFAAERIRQAVEHKHIKAYDEDLKVTISIGISTFPADANDTPLLIDRADGALYQAKHKGRNKVCAYEDVSA